VSRRNRVTPFGEIIATPERGSFMGNRGVLHNDQGQLLREWDAGRWLLCLLEFRGRRRTVMAPRHYTELFFLDEATGLSAGHRPCFECRRGRFNAFRAALLTGTGGSGPMTAAALDARLHAERLGPRPSRRVFSKQTFAANPDDLPEGVFVVRERAEGVAWLLWKGRLLVWSPGGYRESSPRPSGERVRVLTPPSTVEALRAGYVPEVHPSADLG
jgi:hypothetical protein